MILPTQQAHGVAASNLLQSVLDTIDRKQQEEDDKRFQRPKDDAVLSARTASRDANRKAEEKIASTLFDVQHQDPNRIKIDLAERLGRKLGLDVDALKASSSLGAALDDAIKELDYPTRQKLEKELGLDRLKLNLQDLVQAIRQPDPRTDGPSDGDKPGSGDPFLNEAKAKQRLEDVARQKTSSERKADAQHPAAGRIVDEEIKAEDKQDLKVADALTKLEDVVSNQKAVKDAIEKTASGTVKSHAGTVDLLLIAGAAADLAKTEASDPSSDEYGDGQSASHAKADTAGQPDQSRKLLPFPVRIDEIGLYTALAATTA